MAGTIEGTLKHALFLSRHINQCDPQYVAVVVLLELGVSPKRSGFDHLKNAIMLRFRYPTQILTKDIYPAVGGAYDPKVSVFQVEQTIRSAITKAWENRDDRVWGYYFPPDRNGRIKKPSNAEFISIIARFIELWEGCCKEVSHERA